MIKLKHLAPLFLVAFFCYSCTSGLFKSKKEIRTVTQMIDDSPVFARQFTGFVLYDPETKETLINKNGSNYFTPASNTKILSCYTALKILGDSLPVLNYLEKEEAFYFWGTGNPLLLHPDFDGQNEALELLRKAGKPLRLVEQNFRDGRFGEGWMWDDYPYYFQVEKSALPLYGNAVRFTLNPGAEKPEIYPEYFRDLSKKVDNTAWFDVSRDENLNLFEYTLPAKGYKTSVLKEVPFLISGALLRHLLTDTLGVSVLPGTYIPLDSLAGYQTLYTPMPDSLYRRLMQQSDNFIAEQLLLMCSDKVFGVQNTQQLIEYAKNNVLTDMPDELLWTDGSGVSRYNMFTPRSLVILLDRMRMEFTEKRLFDLFPAGGQSGTIENWYGANKPYLYAKSGSLRNTYCLSGYMLTDSGRTLIFSFMNNHFKGTSGEIKEEMEKVLKFVKERF